MSAYEVWNELIRGGWEQLTQWRAEAKPEGLHLDYKEANWTGKDISDDDRKNLAKNLSGFGNIDGGVLVFGAATRIVDSSKIEVLNALKGVTPLDEYEERVRIYIKDQYRTTHSRRDRSESRRPDADKPRHRDSLYSTH